MPSPLLPSLFGVAILAIGQIVGDNSSNSGNEIDRPALLREAHELASQVAPEERAGILSRVAHGAGILKIPEAKSWSQELFDLAANLKRQERETVQESAASAMSNVDPAAALTMLLAVKPAPPPEFRGHVFAPFHHNVPETQTTSAIFTRYFEHYGVAGLPELERAAQNLATHGDYPFSAWSKIVVKLRATDSRQGQHVVKKILNAAAVAPYQPDPMQDELMQFLIESSPVLPASTKRELVQIGVKRILDSSQKDSDDWRGEYNIAMGPNPAKFTNSTDATLYRYLATIRNGDPELADSLLKTRPELAAAPQPEAGGTRGGFMSISVRSSARSGSGSGLEAPSAPRVLREPPRLPPQFTRERDVMNIIKESSSDPKGALAAADALNDDVARAKVYAQLASGRCCDPGTAAELLTKANALCARQDGEDQMDCLIDIASASLTRNDAKSYEDAVARFFQVASQAQKRGRDLSLISRLNVGVLARGIDSYPQRTLAAIRTIPDIKLRAEYLADAGMANIRGRREYGEIVMDME